MWNSYSNLHVEYILYQVFYLLNTFIQIISLDILLIKNYGQNFFALLIDFGLS